MLRCRAGLSDRVFRCSGSHHIPRDFPRDVSHGVVPADVAKVVAADAASLTDDGTLSLPDHDGTLSPTNIAGILFPAVPPCWDTIPGRPCRPCWHAVPGSLTLLGRCPRLTLTLWALMGCCPRPPLPGFCFRPSLLGCRSQQAL